MNNQILKKLKDNVKNEDIFLATLRGNIDKNLLITAISDDDSEFVKYFIYGVIKAYNYSIDSIVVNFLKTYEDKGLVEKVKNSIITAWVSKIHDFEFVKQNILIPCVYNSNISGLIRTLVDEKNDHELKSVFESNLFKLHLSIKEIVNNDNFIVTVINATDIESDTKLKDLVNYSVFLNLEKMRDNAKLVSNIASYFIKLSNGAEKDENIENLIKKSSTASKDFAKQILPKEITESGLKSLLTDSVSNSLSFITDLDSCSESDVVLETKHFNDSNDRNNVFVSKSKTGVDFHSSIKNLVSYLFKKEKKIESEEISKKSIHKIKSKKNDKGSFGTLLKIFILLFLIVSGLFFYIQKVSERVDDNKRFEKIIIGDDKKTNGIKTEIIPIDKNSSEKSIESGEDNAQ